MASAFQAPYLHFSAFSLAILILSFYFFARKASAAYKQLRMKWNPPAPYDPRLLKYDMNAALFRSLFVLFGLILFLSSLYLTRYDYLGDKATPGGEANFRKNKVEFRSVTGAEMTVPVQGHKAAAAGIILRFPKWIRFSGLGNYHRTVTFRGFDENEYHYNPPPAEWVRNYADTLFILFYKNRNWLKFPEAFYVESPYFNPGKHQIFVTHSGYIVD